MYRFVKHIFLASLRADYCEITKPWKKLLGFLFQL